MDVNTGSAIPDDFVVVNSLTSDIRFDIRYFTHNNFVGERVDGYFAPLCVLHRKAAKGLLLAADAAKQAGFRLRVFDCYRPQTAVNHFVRWASDLSNQKTKPDYYPNLDKRLLLGPYIAPKSGHSRGSSIDLGLEVRLPGGGWELVDMGTSFDFFDETSNTSNPKMPPNIIENRQQLIGFMRVGGFTNYSMEWWHFSLQSQPYTDTYFDFPVL